VTESLHYDRATEPLSGRSSSGFAFSISSPQGAVLKCAMQGSDFFGSPFLSGFLFDFVGLRRMFKPPERFALETRRAVGQRLD
jgi:hypothetical protein